MQADYKKRRLIIIVSATVLLMIFLTVLGISRTNRTTDPVGDYETTIPKIETHDTPTTIVYRGFNSLKRVGLSESQYNYLTEHLTYYFNNTEKITSGNILLTDKVISPFIDSSDFFIVTTTITTPKNLNYKLEIRFKDTGDMFVSLYNEKGVLAYTYPSKEDQEAYLDDH